MGSALGGRRLHSHRDHSLLSAQTCQRFRFVHLPADTSALSLGGDEALCFHIALKCLNTIHKQENIRAGSKQKGLRGVGRISTGGNTNTKAAEILSEI